jgi:hypothetical protein
MGERADVVAVIAQYSLRTREVDELFRAFGWDKLTSSVMITARHDCCSSPGPATTVPS